MEDQPKIRVVVRKRPLTRKQQSRNQVDIIEIRDGTSVVVREKKQKVDLTKYVDQHLFTFDNAYDQRTDNSTIYLECVRPIVYSAFLGAKVTCFAYGQTGSGKTYTMNGDPSAKVAGMYILSSQDIFQLKQQPKFKHLAVSISFYEIYCGKLYDLLNNRQVLQLREDSKQNVNVIGLTEKRINTVHEFMQVIEVGSAVRITSQNSTNADSSRSHAILQISLLEHKKVFGKISFIDLAGCERGADTIDQNKQTRIDGAEINKSLLALKQCIRALDNGKGHTPFRGSKLTMVLKDSFVGFCKTLMIGNISPNESACQNTLNTLRYADRVKQLEKGGQKPTSKQDQLAKQLMLPRMQKNKQSVYYSQDDQSLNQQKLFPEPRRQQTSNAKMEEEKPPTSRELTSGRRTIKSEMEEEIENMSVNRLAKVTVDKSMLSNYRSNADRHCKSLNQSLQPNTFHRNNLPQSHHQVSQQIQPCTSMNLSKGPITNEQYNQCQQLLEDFRVWQPRQRVQLHHMSNRYQQIGSFIAKQQEQVLELHKGQLQFQNEYFGQSLKMYNQIFQQNKPPEELYNYAHTLQSMLDRKVALLCHLKNKLGNFKYHLKEHQACSARLKTAAEMFSREEDEVSLLDSVNQDEQLFMKASPNNFYFNSQQQYGQYGGFQGNHPSRASQPIGQHNTMLEGCSTNMVRPIPTHNHNTRYSLSVNMQRSNGMYGQNQFGQGGRHFGRMNN